MDERDERGERNDEDGDGHLDAESPGERNEKEPRSAASVATEGEDWRISVDDLDRTNELTPGDPTLENVLFVLLGVAFALAVIAQFVVGIP